MFSITSIIIAFFAGILGTLIGGTQTFICTGAIGIIVTLLKVCHIDTTFINDTLLNTLFLPAIIFNGAAFATAYASQHHPIRGVETGRSLAFTNDSRVLLMGGFAGMLGYMIYTLANDLALPIDTGALSVVIIGMLGRFLYNKENQYNKIGIRFLKTRDLNYWLFQIIMAVTLSLVTAYFAKETKLYTIGFSISAISLIFALSDSAFPATHHVTLIAGYAMMQTQNIMIAILFGTLSHFIGLIFSYIFNLDCGTHVDPPAVAIGSLSFILFAFF